MRYWIIRSSVLLLLAGLTSALAEPTVEPRPFVHPGMSQNADELAFMKQKVLAGEQPWKGAWDRLLAGKDSSLAFKPKPFAHVVRSAYGKRKIGADELAASSRAAYSHALQWYITGNQAHARKAIEIFNAWAPVLHDFQENDAKLLAGWTGFAFCNAAEILRDPASGWKPEEIAAFKRMLMEVYYPLLKDYFPAANGNWDAAIMSTMMGIGIFCDNRAIFDGAVEHYRHGPLNGGITHYIYPSGQCQETTRDHGHTQLGLEWMAKTARIAWTQGVDLFGFADNRLALGFEYTAKYLSGKEVPAEGPISPRIDFADVYLPAYQHYHFDLGMEMPFTAIAVEKTLPKASLTVLTAYRGAAKTGVAKADGPRPSPIAAQAGAMHGSAFSPPPGAVLVKPGESIQQAIDGFGAKAGCIILAKGLHKLDAPIRLRQGITLAGEGVETMLWVNGKVSAPAIINAEPRLQDAVLRDFIIEGATATEPPRDPNSARRQHTSSGAPRRGGIEFVGTDSGSLSNIWLEHITVRNCTDSGIVITGARKVMLQQCSLTDNGNGSAAAPRPNLLLTRVEDCQIQGSRLNNSPSGNGVGLVKSRNINISGNEIARNATEGVCGRDSQNVQVVGNLVEGNETAGMAFPDESRGIQIINNLIRDNTSCAVQASALAGRMGEGNKLYENGSGQ